MAEVPKAPGRWSGKPFALWVILGSLAYFGVALAVLSVPLLVSVPGAASDPFTLSVVVFIVLFLFGAYAAFRGTRWGLILAVALSVVFLVLFGPILVPALANPADPNYWLTFSGIPALSLAAVFSIFSLLAFRKGISQKRYLASVKSGGGLLTIAVVGFVVGGVVVGAVASSLTAQIVANGGEGAGIRIVPNASNPQTATPFSPKTLTVRAGTTVTWFNGDTVIHTITSDTGLFDSGNRAPGAFYNHTFAQAGTYAYHCTPHPSMTGTIVVTP